MSANDVVFDGLIDDAIEVLVERTGQRHSVLHAAHDVRAFELLAADVEHSGSVTLTARMLADALVPRPAPRVVVLAEHRERKEGRPSGWLAPETFERCLSQARAALVKGES